MKEGVGSFVDHSNVCIGWRNQLRHSEKFWSAHIELNQFSYVPAYFVAEVRPTVS